MAEKQKPLRGAEEKFFAALNDSYDALLNAIEAGSERGYRVSKGFIEEARKAQREAVELGKKVVEAPSDLAGFYGALVEATSKAQSRSLELAREWLGEAGKEARDAMQQLMKANQAAARAAAEAARSGFARAREASGGVKPKAEERQAGPSPEPASGVEETAKPAPESSGEE